jgi:hypothetical protein
MTPRIRLISLLALALAWCAPAVAQSTVEVRDATGLFTPATVARVNDQISKIHTLLHRDVLVETIKDLPEAERQKLDRARRPGKEFAALARKKAQEHGVNGVYVLICTDPHYRHMDVVTYPDEQEAILSPRECEEARRQFVGVQRNAGADRALVDTIKLIEDRMTANLPDERNALTPLGWLGIGLIILAAIFLFLICSAVRARLAKQGTPVAQADDRVAPALIGGVLGSPVNQWMYDQQVRDATRPAEGPAGNTAKGQGGEPRLDATPSAPSPAAGVPDREMP